MNSEPGEWLRFSRLAGRTDPLLAAPTIRAKGGVLRAQVSVFPRHLDAFLLSISFERMTIGRLMPALR